MFAINQKSSVDQEVIGRLDGGGGNRSWAGARITPTTAMQQATVFACVRILSETIGALPIKTQTRNAGTSVWVDTDHDSLMVLDKPNDFQNQHDLISTWVAWMELRGNAYSFKARAGEKVKYLLPLQTPGVSVTLTDDWRLRYHIGAENGFSGEYDGSEILHLKNFGTNGYEGESTIGKLRHDIGLSQRAKEHSSGLFSNGAMSPRYINAKALKTADEARSMQKDFDDAYSGAERSYKTPVIYGESTLHELGMSSTDAQLLELLKLEKEEISAAFGVPGFLLNASEKSTTWGTGLEQITKSFMRFSLRPRINRLAASLKYELLGRNERKNTRFVFETDAFTMGSFKEVIDAAAVAINNGVYNPNEVRTDMLGKPPRDGGDVYRETPNSKPEGSENTEETDEDEA